MDEKTGAQLQEYITAIAEILYAEANPDQIQDLEGIEKSVRNLTQEHLMPKIGKFLSENRPEPKQEENALSKAFWEVYSWPVGKPNA